jgi:hypothetical protein
VFLLNIHQLEAIQRRAARFVYNNFYDREPGVVTSMISRLQWEALEQRRAKARATFMYKIVNNLVDVQPCLELVNGVDLTYSWWYGVPGDDGTREERISIYISICIQCSVGCITSWYDHLLNMQAQYETLIPGTTYIN